jgi:hypothetical protein
VILDIGSVWVHVRSQVVGRLALRFTTPSVSASFHILRTPAAPAPAAIARIATEPRSGSRSPSAIINPTSAVKTASTITRGFISVTKSGSPAVKRSREGNRSAIPESLWSSWSILAAPEICLHNLVGGPFTAAFTARRHTAEIYEESLAAYTADILAVLNLMI